MPIRHSNTHIKNTPRVLQYAREAFEFPTYCEHRFANALKRGLGRNIIYQQYIINTSTPKKKSFAIADFAHPKKKILIEIDGSIHHTDENLLRDVKRDRHLKKLGWKTLRYTNEQIRQNLKATTTHALKHMNINTCKLLHLFFDP